MIRLLVSFLAFLGGMVAASVWLHTTGQATFILGCIAGVLAFGLKK